MGRRLVRVSYTIHSETDSSVASPAFGVGSPLMETPMLLHIGHPYALTNLHTILTHVKNFRVFLGQLSARGENAQIAKDVLVDLVDCSGFDIDALCSFLAECVREANNIPGPPSLLLVNDWQEIDFIRFSKNSGTLSANICDERVPPQNHREVNRCSHH